MKTLVAVATLSEIAPGQMKVFVVDGKRIVLARAGGVLYAFDDACTHDDGPLSEGELEADRVICPWHFSSFSLKTGEVIDSPAEEPMRVYSVHTENDIVYLDLE